MKKKIVLMSIAVVLVMTAIIGGTLAGFNTESEQGKTDITTKSLGIDLAGSQTPLGEEKLVANVSMPGAEIEMPYYITNNVQEGYELYTRVTLYKYWENEELDGTKIHLYVKDSNGNAVELTALEDADAAVRVNDWFIQYSDEEQVILYYAKPLAAGERTGNVLDLITVSPEVGNAYTNQNITLEIQADAVQKIAADASIPSEWGVYPTFDADGNIVSIAE